MSELRHIYIKISYEVYQTNNVKILLVGKYPCRCTAEDIVSVLTDKGIDAYYVPVIKEEIY